jgi:dihydroneopterin aldolase
VERVTSLLETSRFRTMERLNTVILEALLAFPRVRRARSRLVKVAAPIPGFNGRITVAMTRAKAGGSERPRP